MNRNTKKNAGTSKYNVKGPAGRTYKGIVFDSAIEMRYYADVLSPLIKSGEVKVCEMQKRYTLQPGYVHKGKKVSPIEYKADFYVVDSDGKEIVVDVKGCPTPVAIMKRKMFWYTYPDIEYVWMCYSKVEGGWVTYDQLKSNKRQRKQFRKI